MFYDSAHSASFDQVRFVLLNDISVNYPDGTSTIFSVFNISSTSFKKREGHPEVSRIARVRTFPLLPPMMKRILLEWRKPLGQFLLSTAVSNTLRKFVG